MLLADGGIIFLSVLKLGGVSWHSDGRKELLHPKGRSWETFRMGQGGREQREVADRGSGNCGGALRTGSPQPHPPLYQ